MTWRGSQRRGRWRSRSSFASNPSQPLNPRGAAGPRNYAKMSSGVTAKWRENVDPVTVLETLSPGGSITGAPKLAAIQALRRLEHEPRGAYCGSMGWIEPGGDASFNVLIRTLELLDGAGTARLGLGSGLVVASV